MLHIKKVWLLISFSILLKNCPCNQCFHTVPERLGEEKGFFFFFKETSLSILHPEQVLGGGMAQPPPPSSMGWGTFFL